MNHTAHLIYILLFSLLCQVQAQDNNGLLKAANNAYQNNSFDESIQQYHKIIDNGYHSIAVYNNLGSSYHKSGDIPNAILFFEKGLKLDPFNKALLHNLNIAKEQLDSDIVQVPEFFLKKAWKYLFTRASSNIWYILGILLSLLTVGAFGLWLLHSARQTKKKGFFAGIVLFTSSILCFFASSSQANFQYVAKTGVVMRSGIDLKSAPEDANEAIMTLLPGTKLFIVDKIGEYEKVRLENGQLGWVPLGSYTFI